MTDEGKETMKTAAIICEYNPFHKGHLYQISRIKEQLNPDHILCIMSGDFVQRGETAVFDKETRTKMALNSGVDVVLLLPTVYSTGAADLFARGSVTLLDRLGCIDYLCFGGESANIEELDKAGEAIMERGTIESPEIKGLMSRGLTYPEARAALFPELNEILKGSNNILAIEYLIALKKINSSITPFLINRVDNLVNDETPGEGDIASATSIRNLFKENKGTEARNYIPDSALNTIRDSYPMFNNNFSDELRYKLLNTGDFSEYLEVSGDLSDRILKNRGTIVSFDNAVSVLSARNFTEARIKRALIHILLGIKGDNNKYKEAVNEISHIRVLGFNKKATPLLHEIKAKGHVSLCTKLPDVYPSFSEITKEIYDIDNLSFALYDGKLASLTGKPVTNENSKELVIL